MNLLQTTEFEAVSSFLFKWGTAPYADFDFTFFKSEFFYKINKIDLFRKN